MPAVLTTSAREPIAYRVSMAEPASHEYQIEMRVPPLPSRDRVDLVFPAWAPGSYMVRDFVRHVFRLEITDGRGRALAPGAIARVDKQRWRLATGGRAFRVRYRVFAFEATVRTSFLDDSHGYWNGTSLFFYVDGELQRPCEVTVAPARAGWKVATALPAARRRGSGQQLSYAAANFDELADSPFEVGTHALHTFSVGRTRFELALYGRTNADPGRLRDILRRVVTATGRIFGGFPFDRYLFIVHALPVGSGGLEHRASVTMDIAGLSFDDEAGYVRFADLAAHEFFHAWNVKRIHDSALGTSRREDPERVLATPRDGLRAAEPHSVHALDYTRECYTRLLWLYEGCTDYLAHVVMLRAGITRERQFLRMIADDWPKYATRPGRNETSLEELSFEAWIKQYKPSENFTNRSVSYYEKGFWTAMALDLTLRLENGGRRGLPEMIRRLWDRFGRRDRPITDPDVRAAAAAIAGRRLDRFFDRYVRGKNELPLPALLRRAGLNVGARAEWDEDDKPAAERDPVRSRRARAWTGLALHADRTTVRNVIPDSPAWRAGLTFGDEVVAVDGVRTTAATFAKRIADHAPGARVRVAFFRRDQLAEADLTLGQSPERKLSVAVDPKAGVRAQSVRRGWFGVPAAGARPRR